MPLELLLTESSPFPAEMPVAIDVVDVVVLEKATPAPTPFTEP